jgi:hypothetical protein
MSSLLFRGNATSYLSIPNTDAFDFGTGDFTIEWYQYQTDNNAFPRIFQVGSYSTGISIGVSIEGGRFYYWRNSSSTNIATLASSAYKNQWVHFAISRASGVTKVFMNGTALSTISDTTNFNGVNDLTISNESNKANASAFGGYITYFTWVKGVSLYNADFTVSNAYPVLTNDYVLLLRSSGFDGTLGSTVINNDVSTIPQVPPNFLDISINNNNNNGTSMRNMRSLFSDNSRVYYKPGSLASCGVGSVRNSAVKSRKT